MKVKWERKKYLKECDSDTIKNVIKITLQMWQVNCNYEKNNIDAKYQLSKILEDATEHVLECGKAKCPHFRAQQI